jgi:hypothetical protein
VTDLSQRAALTIYSTLLGGSMGSRLFDEIREQRGLCYSVYAADHAFADLPVLQLGSGLESGKCVEAFTAMKEIVGRAHAGRPARGGGRARPRVRRGRRVLAFENTNAVGPPRRRQVDRLRRVHRPDDAIARSTP